VRDDHNDPATARQHFLEFADAGIEVVLEPAASSIARPWRRWPTSAAWR
jgi:hypothetical protein